LSGIRVLDGMTARSPDAISRWLRLSRPSSAGGGPVDSENIDGATAVVFSELGLAPELGKGLFVLSRSVGLLAHAYEQSQESARIKGPLPAGIGAH
jgi:citrate synthase